jgi:hypothetical protein
VGTVWAVALDHGWRWSPTMPGRRTILLSSLAIYLVLGLYSNRALGLGGDEPHYLVITHSLLVDHDLQIENNHARGDYRSFYGGALRPDFLRRGQNGAIYSIHAPGLPALLLPAYALAGAPGAVALMCVIAALAALAIFDLAEALAGRGAAVLTWAAVCLTVPFIPHAWLIYPEMPAALITAWAALWLAKPLPDRVSTWIWRGGACAALPWLHTKYVVLLAILAAFLALRLATRPRQAAAFLAPIAVSVGLWLYSFYAIYGTWDPQVPYGAASQRQQLVENIPHGVIGLLFDQKFGLLFHAPVYALAAAGCWLMLVRADLRRVGVAVTLTTVAFVASSTRYYMWWGGASAPARFLVPILPLLAAMLAVAVSQLRGMVWRAAVGVFLFTGLGIAFLGAVAPGRLYFFSPPHGTSQLLEAFQGSAPLSLALPTFTEEDWQTPALRLVPWVGASVAGLLAALVVAQRKRLQAAPFWTAVSGTVAFGFVGALAGSSLPAAARATAANRGQAGLMAAYDAERLRGFDYRRLTTIDDAAILRASTLVVRRGPGAWGETPERVVGPFTMPPGRYEAHVWFDAGPADRDVLVSSERTVIARSSGALANPAVVAFELPVTVNGLSIGVSSPSIARAVQRVDIEPQSLVPRSTRAKVNARVLESIPGHPGAYIIYTDDMTYPEGGVYWTRAKGRSEVIVALASARRLVLTLHVGAAGGPVRVEVAGEDRSVTLGPEETRVLEVPVREGTTLVPVAVQASQAFRPVDVDRTSADTRWLGCQVRIEVR